jgi:hypothetical protein
VFCFFSDDLDGFKQIARHLATWLEQIHEPTIPRSTRPRVVIVTEKIPSGVENEKEATKAFLWLLSEESKRDLFEQVSSIEIIALFPSRRTLCQCSPQTIQGTYYEWIRPSAKA